MAVTINEGTQTDIYTKLSSGTEVQVIKLDMGAGTALEDFSGTLKEITNIAGGTISSIPQVSVGTIPQVSIGTIPNANIATGTITTGSVANVAKVHDAGTLTTGSLANVAMLHAGTVNISAIAGDIPGGTTDLVTGVGTLGSVSNIAVIHNAGTVAGLPDLPGGTIDSIVGGTLAEVGSIGNIGMIHAGTVTTSLALNSGTITTGSLSNIAMLHAGTVAILGTVPVSGASAGTDVNLVTGTVTTGSLANIAVIHNAGTIAALPTLNLTTGTITTGSLTNLAMLHAGTLTSSGTTTGVGVVSNLTIGSVRMTIGTLTTGSITNVALVGSITNIGVLGSQTNLGSITNIGSIAAGNLTSSGTTTGVGTVSNLGSLNTVTSVSNIVTGTLASVTVSNIYAGSQVLIAQAVGTTGGTVVGTLSAASGAGTYHWVSGLQIVVSSGTTDVFLGYGTTTTGGSVLARGQFTPGGGIMRDFTFPVRSVGTNSEICYIIAGAGTASIAVNYWKGV